jgi:hypothetical protein
VFVAFTATGGVWRRVVWYWVPTFRRNGVKLSAVSESFLLMEVMCLFIFDKKICKVISVNAMMAYGGKQEYSATNS